ncbi:hypothetical protein ACRRTK_020281 [Alexandromys fortis]
MAPFLNSLPSNLVGFLLHPSMSFLSSLGSDPVELEQVLTMEARSSGRDVSALNH